MLPSDVLLLADLVSPNHVLMWVVVAMVPTEQSAQADFIHETRRQVLWKANSDGDGKAGAKGEFSLPGGQAADLRERSDGFGVMRLTWFDVCDGAHLYDWLDVPWVWTRGSVRAEASAATSSALSPALHCLFWDEASTLALNFASPCLWVAGNTGLCLPAWKRC